MSLTPSTIEERTAELAALHAEIFGKKQEKSQQYAHTDNGGADGHTSSLSDEEIILLARHAKNGARFSALYAGDTSGYVSASEADLALCNNLAFYCGPDPARIDRLFRQSGLYRPKWDEKHFSGGLTYGEATIAKALAGAREFYSRGGSSNGSGNTEPPSEDTPWPGDEDTPPESEEAQGARTARQGATEQSSRSQQEDKNNTNSSQPWPVLDNDALHGLPGDIVRAIDPYTEADPVSTLLNILTEFGNCINATAYATVQHDRHPARLFAVQVGDTAKGRKGTGWSTPRHLFSRCDADWIKNRVKSGLSSGEGLISHVRDPIYKREAVKEKGRVIDYQDVCIDDGEQDKRLLVIEPEFASTLAVASRDGSILSAVLRQAWDDGHLTTLARNDAVRKTALTATDAHISIIAHISKQELLARLDDTSKANGFANRFLWALVRRSKEGSYWIPGSWM